MRALRDLCEWMRSAGVAYARTGDLELRLGPPPAPPASEDAPLQLPPEDVERRELETLLHSSGADVTPFLKRAAA